MLTVPRGIHRRTVLCEAWMHYCAFLLLAIILIVVLIALL